MRFPFFAIGFLAFCAYGQDATSGLFVCDNGDGMQNIVTAAQKTGSCQPYRKGLLGNTASASSTPLSAPAQPVMGFALSGLMPQNTDQPPSPTPTGIVPSTHGKKSPVAARKAELPVENLTPVIYVCVTPDGREAILEASAPPYPDCQAVGQKGEAIVTPTNTAKAEAPAPVHKGKPGVRELQSAGIPPADSPPQDIYKCFDHTGNPTFVRANERSAYRGCSFFSRSFAGVSQQFRHQAVAEKSLTELAKAGLNQKQPEAIGPRLLCTGSGTASFNGEQREFNCATRSFDYTPGTSGGEVRLGDRQASIAAHRLDYMSTGGSCGGTVTAENGRILHLEPTKDCPESFKIEARRIAAEVERALNINVSGAFKERQRGLAAQINEIAAQIGVDPYLVHAVISAESAYKSRAVSHVGAQGLMQLMPATARRFNVSDPFNTGQNIRGGTTYLKWLLREFNGNMELAVAGYNAGEGNVKKYGYKIPPFIETKAYVPKVMQYYRKYRANPAEIGL